MTTHPERVLTYLRHIDAAATNAISYLDGFRSVEEFEQDQRSQDAVIRNIEIIGEAASKIQKLAPEFVAEHAAIPWDGMYTMRNKVIHEYFNVDLETVWETVKADLPQLKEQIAPLLAQQIELQKHEQLQEQIAREKAHYEAQEREQGQEPGQEQEYSR